MGRKRIIRIPATAKIKCTHCAAISVRKVPADASPQYFDCDKCNQRVQAPMTSCCIICAYTNKKCVPSLMLEARSKRLELRG